jgi:hypothetical protein
MARKDTLAETALVTDQGLTNEETDMVYPPNYSAGSCPESAGDITVNQNIIDLGASAGAEKVDTFTGITGTEVELSFTPLSTVSVKLFINGVHQENGVDFSILSKTVTLAEAVVADDELIFEYFYEVTV